MTASTRPAALVVVALLVGGCLDGAEPSVAPTPTRAPEPTATVTTYELGQPVWYAGVVVTFERATAVLDARGGSVSVQLSLRNEGSPDPIGIPGPVRLVIGGDAFEPTRESVIPEAALGSTAGTTIEFDVVGHHSADEASIVIGRETEHQPRVPFGPDGGELEAFEPVAFDLSGAATAGDLRLRLRGAELRWDLPDWAQQLPSSMASLTVTYDAAYVGTFAGGFPFTAENVALRLPDGTLVQPRPDGRSQPIELIGARKNKRNLRTRFEIPAAITGELALVAIDGKNRRFLAFSLPE
jgi:hypothetical protein